ncbi:MAG: extracellular solute-binding protein [Rubrivivax sp.]|nr:extracellular solute-binding protein [Rubrivivax sp.]
MKRKWSFSTLILVGLFLVIATSVSAQKRPMTVAEIALYKGPDRQQILEEGAKKEGRLTFYTSGILKQAVRPVVDAFQKKYPFIKVEIWRAGSDTLIPRVLEEFKAGRHILDVVESTQTTHMTIQKAGIPQPFYSPNLAFIEEDAITKAKGEGALAAAFRESGISVGYNTKLLTKDQLPKTYQDLLNPKWKGKMAIAGSDTGQNWMGTILVFYGEDFLKKLVEQKFDVHMVSARAVLDMVINGEYILSPTIFDSHVINSKQQGAPCDWIPIEPVHVNIGQIALYKHSPSPHAAMLFIDFELSKEGAEIHKETGYSPTRKDVVGAKTYKKFYGARSLEEAIKWDELFSRLFLKK